MLSFVTWKWKPAGTYRSTFGPETVNTLRRMVARHYGGPHRFILVTDDPAGVDPGIEIVPLWKEFSTLPSPHGRGQPSCYRRLKMFSAEAAHWFGPRFVSMDLDCVITGDLSPIVDRPEEFCIWGDTNPTTPYNGSLVLMSAGARRQVYDDFDPARSPLIAKRLGYFGSDQAWIGARLGPGEAKWTAAEGVYSFRNQILPIGGRLPDNARIVIFHGRVDPWSGEAQKLDWVREHYR